MAQRKMLISSTVVAHDKIHMVDHRAQHDLTQGYLNKYDTYKSYVTSAVWFLWFVFTGDIGKKHLFQPLHQVTLVHATQCVVYVWVPFPGSQDNWHSHNAVCSLTIGVSSSC